MKKLALFAFVAALGFLFSGCDDKQKQETTPTEAPATEAAPEAPATEAAPEAPATEAAPEAPATEAAPEAK